MKDYKKLNVYLSDLAVMNTKLHNLHWNVEGRNFYQTHKFTEGLYETFFEWVDEVAEAIRMREAYPFASLKEYLENATIKEVSSKAVSVDEVNETIMEDLVKIKDEATALRNEADEEGDFTLVSLLEDQVAEMQKNIWFLKASKPCCK